jgi:hypothetical protein
MASIPNTGPLLSLVSVLRPSHPFTIQPPLRRRPPSFADVVLCQLFPYELLRRITSDRAKRKFNTDYQQVVLDDGAASEILVRIKDR